MYDYEEIIKENLTFMDDQQINYDTIYPRVEEFEGSLPKGSLIERLWILWKMYVDFYVVGNQELKRIMFHSFLGVVLTHKKYKYIVSGDTLCSTRIHTFIIQQSGTGKSQIMKAWNKLLEFVDIPCDYTTHDNESHIIGSTDEKRDENGKPVMKPGSLSYLYALCWDEGEILLSRSVPFLNVDVMTAQFQSMMDEPGEIKGKGMRQGKLKYSSNTTLIAGSYMFDQFRQVMLQKGFLQRMFIYYKNFTEEEKDKITVGIELMKLQKHPEKIKRVRIKILECINEIPINTEPLSFKKTAIMKWIPVKLKIRTKLILNAYSGEKQSILETFFNRFHNIIDKIACQHAVLMGKRTVDFEDILYGKDQAMIHLSCILNCFDNVKTDFVADIVQERRNTMMDIVKKHPGITQGQLFIELKRKKERNKWDLGAGRTFEMLKDMSREKGGVLRIEKGDKNASHFFIKQ